MLSISISTTPPEDGGGIETIVVAAIAAAHRRALDRRDSLCRSSAVMTPPAACTAAAIFSGDRRRRRTPAARRWRLLRACRRDRAAPARSPGPKRRAVGLEEDLRRGRPARQPRLRARQRVGDIVGDRDALARERDRGRDQVGQREFAGAVFLVRQREAGDGARHADGERRVRAISADRRCLRRRGTTWRWSRCGRGLAIVDRRVARRSARWITMKPPPPILPARG